MTIDEGIKRYTDNAEYERTHGNLQGCLDFRQLAEWLKKLKAYEEAREEIIRKGNSGYLERPFSDGLNHAILLIDKHLKEVNVDDTNRREN